MKPLLLCLHGWGGSKESFTELRAALASADIEMLTPDLPGFGGEPEPPDPWTVDDYATWVCRWVKDRYTDDALIERKLFVLGHSHGGRIAIKIAVRHSLPVTHLYLCASAGIKHSRHIKRMIGLTLAKSGKALLRLPGIRVLEPIGKKMLYRLVRVHDYEKASPVMRQTLMEVTKEDFRSIVPKVDVPTDIFWGMDDTMTPMKDGILIHRLIKGSRLHLYKNVRHAVHRDRAAEIAVTIMRSASLA